VTEVQREPREPIPGPEPGERQFVADDGGEPDERDAQGVSMEKRDAEECRAKEQEIDGDPPDPRPVSGRVRESREQQCREDVQPSGCAATSMACIRWVTFRRPAIPALASRF
jgi:hypothetical protein